VSRIYVTLQTLKALNYLKESLKIIHRGLRRAVDRLNALTLVHCLWSYVWHHGRREMLL